MMTAHNLTEPLNGKILLFLKEELVAKSITMNLIGYLRSRFKRQEQFQDETRLAKTLVDVEYKIADFGAGEGHLGMYEYPFSIDLPPEVQPSVMVKMSQSNREVSQQFFIKAQVMPTDEMGMQT